jgi:hypothetical protein
MALLSQFGFGGGIKSIQRLTVTTDIIADEYYWPSTITISSVNTSKAIILVNGQPEHNIIGDALASFSYPAIDFLSSTALSLTVAPDAYSPTRIIPGIITIQVVEYY